MILDHLWQSTLFVIAVGGLALVLRKSRAEVRHRLWMAASVKFLVPFFFLASIGAQVPWRTSSASATPSAFRIAQTISQPFTVATSDASSAFHSATPAPQASRLPAFLFGVWGLGVVASLTWWFIRWRRMRRVLLRSTPSRIDGPIQVMNSPERFEPGVFGIFKPVLLLPEGIAERLSRAQLESVLAHEYCHARRRDNLTMALHMFVEAVFWFHPLVWFIKLRLVAEQEQACDEEVLRLGGEPAAYAESILRICEFCIESPLPCVSGVTGSDLKRRVARIMSNEIGETLNHWRKLGLLSAGLAAFAIPVVVGMFNASPAQNHTRPANTPAWEVVSIKPCAPSNVGDGPGQRGGNGDGPPIRFSADRMTMRCQSTKRLVRSAYLEYGNGVDVSSRPGGFFRDMAIAAYVANITPIEGAPDWMDSDRYTIEAKAEKPVDRGMMRGPMLQALLEDRFKLKLHWENRDIPLLALTVAKGGPKLKPHQEGSCAYHPAPDLTSLPKEPATLPPGQRYCEFSGGLRGPTATHMLTLAEGLTITEFIKTLMISHDNKPIVDRTGLTGKFDFNLVFALDPEARKNFAELTGRQESELDSGPLFVDAVEEQLGLKLQPTKGPWEHLIIDHMEKPKEN